MICDEPLARLGVERAGVPRDVVDPLREVVLREVDVARPEVERPVVLAPLPVDAERGGSGGSMKAFVMPVSRLSPVDVSSTAHGSTGWPAGSVPRSVGETDSANNARIASSYSSGASVFAHQTRSWSSDCRVLSQCPLVCGRR